MTTTTALAVPTALGAAASFGVANVVQTHAARRIKAAPGIDPRFLARLFVDRWWLVGLAASALGFGLQATALFLAPVVLVQPLIVTELLFALPLAAAVAGVRLSAREWAGIVLVASGLAVFLLVAHPSGDRTDVPASAWLAMVGGVATGVAVLVAAAESAHRRPMLRASLLATAASSCFGLLSVLTRTVGHQFDDDGLGAVLHPQPWLLVIVALTGLLLAQTAFRIAPLPVSLPLIDLGEPLIASLIAVTVFGENIGGTAGVAVAVIASALMVAGGVALLDSSPLVRAAQQDLLDSATGSPYPARERAVPAASPARCP